MEMKMKMTMKMIKMMKVFDDDGYLEIDLNDGKILTMMEWLMVFCQSTIVDDGFSMVFYMWTNGSHVKNHWCQWFFNDFFTYVPLVSMVFQWFFRSQPLVSMVFPMVFYKRTIAIEWMVCGLPSTSMVYQWFYESEVNAGAQKRPKRKKTWFVQQKHKGKQT